MTWEMPDRNWKRYLSPTLVLGATAFVLVLKFFAGGEPSQASYESSCKEQGGEWLLHASEPTCVFPGGRLVVLNAPAAAPAVVAPPQPTVMAADDAPGCILGDWITFSQYPSAEAYAGRPHAPDFSTLPEAAKYRTAITKDVARGVNLAGAYVLSTWGQPPTTDGRRTIGFAIIDARDGRILEYNFTPLQVLHIDFTKQSTLIRVYSSVGQFPLLIAEGKVTECGRY